MNRYFGKHREDTVGKPSMSDDDCLTSERIGKQIQDAIMNRRHLEETVYGE